MAKRSRSKARDHAPVEGEVGPRQPCPCGSGKRFKACHGSGSSDTVWVGRPFAGLPSECDIVALREFVPAATAPLTTADREVTLCSLLPVAAPAMVRDSGQVWLGLQVRHSFGDPSRDLAAVLEKALAADEPGIVGLTDPPGAGKRLQDLVTNDRFEITVHDGFDFWLSDVTDQDADMTAALEQANAAAAPTSRLASVEAAYWTSVGTKEHLRWVLPEAEAPLLDALARLHAADRDSIAPDSRLVGMFRAHGLLVPVWDLPLGTGADALESTAATLRADLDEALADDSPLTAEQRAARAGLANRQVTIR
jgi:Family of unknown function (DUF5926)/SEC-C motif